MAEKKDMQKELLELEALELEVTNRRKALRDDAIRQAQSIINQFSLQPTYFHFGEVEPLRKGRRGPVSPKYRGPQGEMWTGRGRTPKWVEEVKKAGKKLEDFLIK